MQWQLQFLLHSFASSGGSEKPANDTGASYATTAGSTPDSIPHSQPQAACYIPGDGTDTDHTNPLQSYHITGTLGCWWLGRHLLSLTVIPMSTWHTATEEQTLWYMRPERRASKSRSASKSQRLSHSQGGGCCKYCVLFKVKLTMGVFFTLVRTPFKNFSETEASLAAQSYLTNHTLSP